MGKSKNKRGGNRPRNEQASLGTEPAVDAGKQRTGDGAASGTVSLEDLVDTSSTNAEAVDAVEQSLVTDFDVAFDHTDGRDREGVSDETSLASHSAEDQVEAHGDDGDSDALAEPSFQMPIDRPDEVQDKEEDAGDRDSDSHTAGSASGFPKLAKRPRLAAIDADLARQSSTGSGASSALPMTATRDDGHRDYEFSTQLDAETADLTTSSLEYGSDTPEPEDVGAGPDIPSVEWLIKISRQGSTEDHAEGEGSNSRNDNNGASVREAHQSGGEDEESVKKKEEKPEGKPELNLGKKPTYNEERRRNELRQEVEQPLEAFSRAVDGIRPQVSSMARVIKETWAILSSPDPPPKDRDVKQRLLQIFEDYWEYTRREENADLPRALDKMTSDCRDSMLGVLNSFLEEVIDAELKLHKFKVNIYKAAKTASEGTDDAPRGKKPRRTHAHTKDLDGTAGVLGTDSTAGEALARGSSLKVKGAAAKKNANDNVKSPGLDKTAQARNHEGGPADVSESRGSDPGRLSAAVQNLFDAEHLLECERVPAGKRRQRQHGERSDESMDDDGTMTETDSRPRSSSIASPEKKAVSEQSAQPQERKEKEKEASEVDEENSSTRTSELEALAAARALAWTTSAKGLSVHSSQASLSLPGTANTGSEAWEKMVQLAEEPRRHSQLSCSLPPDGTLDAPGLGPSSAADTRWADMLSWENCRVFFWFQVDPWKKPITFLSSGIWRVLIFVVDLILHAAVGEPRYPSAPVFTPPRPVRFSPRDLAVILHHVCLAGLAYLWRTVCNERSLWLAANAETRDYLLELVHGTNDDRGRRAVDWVLARGEDGWGWVADGVWPWTARLGF